MGFFKDFKDDITQAVNELLPEDDEDNKENTAQDQLVNTLDKEEALTQHTIVKGLEVSDLLQESLEVHKKEEQDRKEDNIEDSQEADFEIDTISEEDEEAGDEDMDDNVDLELLEAMKMNETEELKVTKEAVEPKVRTASVTNDDEVTVISKGTTIIGSISSDCSLEIMGNVTGDIECLGKLSISGKIKGNSTAMEVFVNTERLEGNIESEGTVKVGLGTVIIGDIVASSGVIAGAIKGEIDVNGPIVIDSTAIIKGNIKAKSVQINNGAVIEGFCSLSYAEVDVDNIFE